MFQSIASMEFETMAPQPPKYFFIFRLIPVLIIFHHFIPLITENVIINTHSEYIKSYLKKLSPVWETINIKFLNVRY